MKERLRFLRNLLKPNAGNPGFKPGVSEIIFFAILLLGLSVRLYRLSYLSLWTDEVATAVRTRDYQFADLSTYPDLVMYWIQSLFYLIFPYGDFFFRLPSAVMGTAGLVFMYLAARQCFGKTEALVAAFLLALSPFHIHYSQEVRHYANMTFFTLGSVWCLLRGLDGGDRRYWFGFGAFGLLNAFNHPVGLFVTALQCVAGAILAFFWPRASDDTEGKVRLGRKLLHTVGPFAAWGFSFLAIYGAFYAIVRPGLLAILPSIIGGLDSGVIGGTIGKTTVLAVAPLELDRGQVVVNLFGRLKASAIPGVTLGFVLVGVVGCIARHIRTLALCLVFLLSALAAITLLSFRMVPFPRYFIWALPFFIMLQARGIVVVAGWIARATRRHETRSWLESWITAFLAIVLFGVLGWPLLSKEYRTEKGIEFKRMARFLEDHCRGDEPVLLDGLPSREELQAGLSVYLYDPARKQMRLNLSLFNAAKLDELGKRWSHGWYVFKTLPIVGIKPVISDTSAKFSGVTVEEIHLASPKPIPIPNGGFETDSGTIAQLVKESSFTVPLSCLPADFYCDGIAGNGIPDGWSVGTEKRPQISLDRENQSDGQARLRVELAGRDSYFQALSLPVVALPHYVFEASVRVRIAGRVASRAYVVPLDARLRPIDYLTLWPTAKDGDWTTLSSVVSGGVATFHGGGEYILATCFLTSTRTAALSIMVQAERGATSGTVVWFDDVRLKGGWDAETAMLSFLEQHREAELADARRHAATLVQSLPEAIASKDPSDLMAEVRATIETCQRFGFPASARRLAETAVQVFPEAIRRGDPKEIIAEGKSLTELCRWIGFSDGAERLAEILIQGFPDRKDLCWLSKSVKSVTVYKYDWLKDPIGLWDCTPTFKDSNGLKADVAKRGFLYPRGHGKPFVCNGTFALQFDLKVIPKGPTSATALRVYLNTRTGHGPDGADWSELDAFSVPVDLSGRTQNYIIPLRSSIEKARFIHDMRIDIPDRSASCSFEIENMQLVRLESSLKDVAPKPEGFLVFQVGAQNLITISTRRSPSTTSPLVLDFSPVKQLDGLVLARGEHILTLPQGWSENDVSVRAIGRDYTGDDFLNTSGGIIQYRVAHLFIQNAKFDVATSLTAKTEYTIAVEAEHSRIGQVTIALLAADGKTQMAQYVFDRRDNSVSWQEKKITPPADMNRISFAFVSDYTGAEGDLNARVSRVRVIPTQPAGGAK